MSHGYVRSDDKVVEVTAAVERLIRSR